MTAYDDPQTFFAALMKAVRMCDHAMGQLSNNDPDDFMKGGHGDELRRGVRLLSSPDWSSQKIGMTIINRLWSEVPHLHPSTPGAKS